MTLGISEKITESRLHEDLAFPSTECRLGPLKLSCVFEPSGNPSKNADSFPVESGKGLRFCISTKIPPVMLRALAQGLYFE